MGTDVIQHNPRAVSAAALATGMVGTAPGQWTNKQVAILKEHIARGATDDELRYFAEVCKRLNLDPFKREIYFIKRWDGRLKREVPQFQTGIDGFRKVTAANPKFAGLVGPQWCGSDEVWRDIWVKDEPPAAARVGIRLAGSVEPTWGIAMYREFCQRTKDGGPSGLWGSMPANQLAKCAEAQAHRKVTPGTDELLFLQEPPQSFGVAVEAPPETAPAAQIGEAAAPDAPAQDESTPEPTAPNGAIDGENSEIQPSMLAD